MISKKGEVSFFLNCALVKNSLKKEEKKKAFPLKLSCDA